MVNVFGEVGEIMSSYHTPVLLTETIEGLSVKPGGKYIDATAGGGGHSAEILRRGGLVLAIDTDPEAVEETRRTLEPVRKEGWTVVEGNFRNIAEIATAQGWTAVDGILFDLGVSSHQLDTKERGFSYRFADAPLDLRLGVRGEKTAEDIVNTASEDDLYEIFSKLGEEKHSRAIAHAVCISRAVRRLTTAGDLIETVRSVVGEREGSATLSRVFQALRIEVNGELDALRSGLAGAETLISQGGRLVVISFHSLEDRIVKLTMRKSGWEVCTKKPITATDEEVRINRRARSAKLRIAVRTKRV